MKGAIAALLCVALACQASLCAEQPGVVKLSGARPGDVRLFASGSLRAPILAIQERLEQATGRRIVLESSESRILQQEIEAGQPFEVALLVSRVVDELIAKGLIVAGSAIPAGAVRVGVSVRGDAPALDVSTAEGLKKAILGAHGIRRYYGVAASVPVLDSLFDRLGLTAATEARMIRLGGNQPAPEAALQRGQYELIINLISAIKPMQGWNYLGPIPEQFQMPVSHSAGLGAAGNRDLGRVVMEVLKGPEFRAALRASGITLE